MSDFLVPPYSSITTPFGAGSVVYLQGGDNVVHSQGVDTIYAATGFD